MPPIATRYLRLLIRYLHHPNIYQNRPTHCSDIKRITYIIEARKPLQPFHKRIKIKKTPILFGIFLQVIQTPFDCGKARHRSHFARVIAHDSLPQ